MIIHTNEVQEVVRPNAYGGRGALLSRPLLSEKDWRGELKLCNRLRLEPGSEIGEHAHTNDFELYYILAGEGILNDNGVEQVVRAGDLIHTSGGERHSLYNHTSDILELLAIVIDENGCVDRS